MATVSIPIAKPLLGKEELKRVKEVLASGMLTSGKLVKEFEESFRRYIGARHAVATFNGTVALHVAMLSLGIGEGDEVVTTPFSFIASSNCILYVGAKPVFVDVDERTFNILPEEIEKAITERTKAVLIVHIFGQPCEMREIVKVCKTHGLLLVEDCAQAHGAEYRGKKVGSFGDAAVFSFYATKNITTGGEGGMLLVKKKSVAKLARMLVDQGQSKKYVHSVLGYNYRMTEIQAAVGLEQLKKLDDLNEKRRKNAEFLTKALKDVRGIETPYVSPHVKHVFHQYVVRVKRGKRNSLASYLRARGIEVAVHYPKPIYKQPVYKKLGYGNLFLPNAERACKEVLSLPVHPSLDRSSLLMLAEAVKRFFRS